MKQKFITDVPVALIFFNRPEVFAQVFECVKRTRPSKLFLIQDGARLTHPSDIENIRKCRDICNDIDWECEVYKDFSDVNLGCGKRIFTGLTNAFKLVDRLVIVEDDIVYSDDFLPFCAELLERYKDDLRIDHISGMNHFGTYEPCEDSYFFTRGGAIWGWATWKRVWDTIDWNLEIADNDYIYETLKKNMYPYQYGKFIADKARKIRRIIKEGKSLSFWSFHLLYYSYLENRVNIVPKCNLISNIGLTVEAVHTGCSYDRLTNNKKKLYYGKQYGISFPLKHPKYVFEDRYFKYIQDEMMYPTGLHAIAEYIESFYRRIRYK